MVTIQELLVYKEQGAFLFVGATNIIVYIKDAPLVWAISPTVLFHTGYRLAGTKESITNVLASINNEPGFIESIIASCLTAQNYCNVANSVYLQELQYYNGIVNKQCTAPILAPAPAYLNPPTNNVAPVVVTTKFEDVSRDVDVFDFQTYSSDFAFFSQFYDGLELYIRTSNWILYKYVRLETHEERVELHTNLEYSNVEKQIKRMDMKDWLDNFTSLLEGHQLLYSWYKHFKPTLLDNVENLYTKWKHHIEQFLNKLYKRYVDENYVEKQLDLMIM